MFFKFRKAFLCSALLNVVLEQKVIWKKHLRVCKPQVQHSVYLTLFFKALPKMAKLWWQVLLNKMDLTAVLSSKPLLCIAVETARLLTCPLLI